MFTLVEEDRLMVKVVTVCMLLLRSAMRQTLADVVPVMSRNDERNLDVEITRTSIDEVSILANLERE
jgi:hypothetical protein